MPRIQAPLGLASRQPGARLVWRRAAGRWAGAALLLVSLCFSPPLARGQEGPGSSETATSSPPPAGPVEAATVVDAPEDDSAHSLTYRSLLVGRLNPEGLIEQLFLTYQLRLYRSESPVLETNYLGVTLSPSLSPSFGRLGAAVDVQPLSVLRLTAGTDWYGYFGNFEYLQSFDSAAADYSDTTLELLSDRETNYAGTGSQFYLGALVQLKVGPVAARSNFRALYSDFDLRGREPVFYDIVNDMLLANEDWAFVNDADLLYLTDFGLVVGVRHNFTRVDYDADDYRPEDSAARAADEPIVTHRLGPLVAYTFFDREERVLFDEPTVLAIVNWYLDHPWRTGEDVSQGVPYLALGFTFSGSLL